MTAQQSALPTMDRQRVFWLWLPLAVSFTLMMLEGPSVQSAIARLGDPETNLAAFGLVLSLSLIIESPVIMLISTSIALARDTQSYRALRNFVVALIGGLTLLTALVAWTPLYDLVVSGLLGIPDTISAAARPGLRIMLLWTAAIGWRRFYQGLLVRHGLTQRVSYGTAIRLGSAILTAFVLVRWGAVSGAQVGAYALMVGVLSEALATYLFAVPLVRRVFTTPGEIAAPPLTWQAIMRFHVPLAATSLLTLLVQPLTAAALARLAQPTLTLAAWPVVFTTLLVLRGWGMALQETTIAQAHDRRALLPLRDFTVIVAVTTSLATAVIAWTPMLDWYLGRVIGLHPNLHGLVRYGLQIGTLLPALTALTSWLRGLLVAAQTTKFVYQGMALNLLVNGLALLLGVWLRLPGILVAAAALLLAISMEYLYLQRQYAKTVRTSTASVLSSARAVP
ncbi:MAG: hypothetical protein M3R24_01730 [Chloroflexota bacterium]|nr:hypothetical protein [Chloroflexota bacterium]